MHLRVCSCNGGSVVGTVCVECLQTASNKLVEEPVEREVVSEVVNKVLLEHHVTVCYDIDKRRLPKTLQNIICQLYCEIYRCIYEVSEMSHPRY